MNYLYGLLIYMRLYLGVDNVFKSIPCFNVGLYPIVPSHIVSYFVSILRSLSRYW